MVSRPGEVTPPGRGRLRPRDRERCGAKECAPSAPRYGSARGPERAAPIGGMRRALFDCAERGRLTDLCALEGPRFAWAG